MEILEFLSSNSYGEDVGTYLLKFFHGGTVGGPGCEYHFGLLDVATWGDKIDEALNDGARGMGCSAREGETGVDEVEGRVQGGGPVGSHGLGEEGCVWRWWIWVVGVHNVSSYIFVLSWRGGCYVFKPES